LVPAARAKLSGCSAVNDVSDERIIRMVELARHHASTKEIATAAFYYEAVFTASQDLKTPVQRVACGEACAWKAETAALQNMPGTAVDWYWRAVLADPLAEELQALYIAAVDRARKHSDEFLCKLEEAK
jgi:hypothetical protein